MMSRLLSNKSIAAYSQCSSSILAKAINSTSGIKIFRWKSIITRDMRRQLCQQAISRSSWSPLSRIRSFSLQLKFNSDGSLTAVNKNNAVATLKYLSNFENSRRSISTTATKMTTAKKCLQLENINPNFITMEYAVRGPIVIRAGEIEKELQQVGITIIVYSFLITKSLQ